MIRHYFTTAILMAALVVPASLGFAQTAPSSVDKQIGTTMTRIQTDQKSGIITSKEADKFMKHLDKVESSEAKTPPPSQASLEMKLKKINMKLEQAETHHKMRSSS